MKLGKTATFAIALCFILGACSPFPDTPTPTLTPEPTYTLAPTSTTAPTSTLAPTATLAPTETPVIIDVKISQPTEGARVGQTETVKGTSQNIPNGSVIWMVIYIPSVRRYFPQDLPADIQVNHEWSSIVSIGQVNEAGLKAEIIAVLADKSTQDAFNAYLQDAKGKNNYAGLETLPVGIPIYQRIGVIRK